MRNGRRVALVTGSATGIGRAIAAALAGAGFDIVINYSRNRAGAEQTADVCAEAGAQTLIVECDVSDEADVEAMIADIESRFAGLDALVNNAGTTVAGLARDFEQLGVEDWDRVFAVNVRGLFLVAKHAAALLRRSSNASIVNTASIVGLRPGPQPLPYSASKAAVISMTRSLAGALGPEIRVNAVAPGWIEGDWMERALGDNYDRLMARRARQTPLGRVCTPEDVAETVLGLIDGNSLVNGQVIVIDGGFSAVT